jgi:drug/metabolite transporter (DMT)-like permease
MTWTKFGLLLLFVMMLACGQVLFKAAAQSIKGPVGFDLPTLGQLAFNPYLLLSFAIYGVATILWVFLLRDIALNRAYLVVALSLILVPLAGTIWFREPFTARLSVGMAIILAGLAVALW